MIRAINIQEVKLDKLNPAPYNPRKILRRGDKGYEKLKNSLQEFGEVLPIVYNKTTGNIVGGHQRYYIYLEEGIKKAQVSIVEIPLEKEKALNITLNNDKVGSEWDYDKLAALVNELDTPELSLTGFEDEDLDSLFSSLQDLNDMSLDSDLENELNKPIPESEEQEIQQLPPGEEPEYDPPEEFYFKLGKFEFMVDAAIYQTWLQQLKENYDDLEAIEEIKIRLQL
jgi:ParB-like chromosome segregation protein Spo0J